MGNIKLNGQEESQFRNYNGIILSVVKAHQAMF